MGEARVRSGFAGEMVAAAAYEVATGREVVTCEEAVGRGNGNQ